jgi:hypothetical protein
MVIQHNKIAITEFFSEIGNIFWNDVGVSIDGKHDVKLLFISGFSVKESRR